MVMLWNQLLIAVWLNESLEDGIKSYSLLVLGANIKNKTAVLWENFLLTTIKKHFKIYI